MISGEGGMMQARFKGIDVIDGAASLRWTPGIQPNSASVRLARAPGVGEEGEFALSDGFGRRISVMMLVESVEENSSVGGGTAWDVVLKDLRALWKFGAITGRYNQPDATGAPTREKNLRELASLCLEAMPRVSSYSTGALPSDEYPAVEWIWENPADALEHLLGERFVVVFALDGEVEVCPANEGRDYRGAAPFLARSLQTRLEKEYDGVVVVGDRTIRQVTRVLMPVGLDVDGKWKALKDLSFAPDKGREDGGFGKEYARDGFRSLAVSQADGPDGGKIAGELLPLIFRVYGGIPGDELPLLNELCEKESDESGAERYRAPYAVGPLLRRATVNGITVTDVVDGPLDGYAIDHQRGLVIFQDAQIQPVAGEQGEQIQTDALAAHLYLVYAFEAKVLDKTDVYLYGDVNAEAPLVVHRPELKLREKWPRTVWWLVPVPPPYQKEYAWEAMNRADLDEYAKVVSEGYERVVGRVCGGTIMLAGLKDDIRMDGLFRSATFTVGPRGSTTEIEWGVETPRVEIPTYRERMRARQADRVAKALSGAAWAAGGSFGAQGKVFGAAGKQFYDAAKRAFHGHAIPNLLLARNTSGMALPAGCPVALCAENPVGDDGIWNIRVPVTNGPQIQGISQSDIAPGQIGYIKSPATGYAVIDVASVPGVAAWDRLVPYAGAYAWLNEGPSADACVVVIKVFAAGARKTALVYVAEQPLTA
jgi:hypothetical protein